MSSTAQKRPRTRVKVKIRTKRRSLAKVLYRGMAVVGLALVAAAFLFAYSLYTRLSISFASASSPNSYVFANDPYPALAYVVLDSVTAEYPKIVELKYVLLDKQTKKVISYSLPVNMAVDVPGKYGVEELSRVYALGNMGGVVDEAGIENVNLMLFKLFGFRPAKYIVADATIQSKLDKLTQTGSLVQFADRALLRNLADVLRTDLSLPEFLGFAGFINSLPSDRILVRDFTYSNLANPSEIDDEILGITAYSSTAKEGKAISVLNGSGTAGLASFGQRVVSNMGGRVVAVANSTEPLSDTVLVVDDPASESVQFLVRAFSIKKIISKADAFGLREAEIDRSDITLILGFDFSQKF